MLFIDHARESREQEIAIAIDNRQSAGTTHAQSERALLTYLYNKASTRVKKDVCENKFSCEV
jgi:hypothetical protein